MQLHLEHHKLSTHPCFILNQGNAAFQPGGVSTWQWVSNILIDLFFSPDSWDPLGDKHAFFHIFLDCMSPANMAWGQRKWGWSFSKNWKPTAFTSFLQLEVLVIKCTAFCIQKWISTPSSLYFPLICWYALDIDKCSYMGNSQYQSKNTVTFLPFPSKAKW